MITNKWKKTLRQLQQKKYRKQLGLFVVEGRKMVEECLRFAAERIEQVFAIEHLCSAWQQAFPEVHIEAASGSDIQACSALQNNQEALAVLRIDSSGNDLPQQWSQSLFVYLDHIQDPGNMGTIMRICDWYGLPSLLVSEDTVDVWNTKTIQASKGSFLRVKVYYCSMERLLETMPPKTVIWGAELQGKDIHTIKPREHNNTAPLILVMGNEANGIRDTTRKFIDEYITIPRYGAAESLNVAMATAILVDNLKRVGY
ncbi:MAG: RNA methyltransferase [Thermonema sp.]|uniref:TrmH family RNA methyltransferase n=1 Tax=Thermonema sp. TaxID=2231181 RepID=UPI0021DEEC5B|nr:RNA methyltransferase [Thermonema sp.]GIV38571.1 MAG: RNA methyltransferase [Thermonema sp.]